MITGNEYWIYTGTNNINDTGGFIIHGKFVHKRSLYDKWVIGNGKRRMMHQSLEDVRRFIDPNAQEFRTKGKRKYLMPLTK